MEMKFPICMGFEGAGERRGRFAEFMVLRIDAAFTLGPGHLPETLKAQAKLSQASHLPDRGAVAPLGRLRRKRSDL